MRFDAPTFARAWLAVSQATGAKDDLAVLGRTVAVEEFPTGVRLVSTDRYVLLTAWVPDLNVKHGRPREPHLHEAPDRTIITQDADARVKGLLAYALQLAKREDPDGVMPEGTTEVRVTFDERMPVNTVGDATLEGLELTYTVVDIPDHERVWAPIVEAPYPDWQALVLGHDAEETKAIALHPDRVSRLVKASAWTDGPIVWTFGGAERVARVDWPDSDPHVTGLVMPARWVLPGEAPDEGGEDVALTNPGPEAEVPRETSIDLADGVTVTGTPGPLMDALASGAETLRAIELVVGNQFGSARMLARKLAIGQDRARVIMDDLERAGIVGPAEGTKARAVLYPADQVEAAHERYATGALD